MVVVLILSIIVHEVAHGYAAYMLGDPTAKMAGRLTLNPLPHIDLFGSIILPALFVLTHAGILFGWAKPVPYNPHNLRNQRWGEAIVGFAGVGTNFLLAIIFVLVARFALGAGYDTFGQLAAMIALVNLFLGAFNLIPFPPLDGYTVLRGIMPYRFSMAFRTFEERLSANGMFSLVIFLVFFSYVLATPFYNFVFWVFRLMLGQ